MRGDDRLLAVLLIAAAIASTAMLAVALFRL
jgi:hypothetical protein